jgi:hypothetical protein
MTIILQHLRPCLLATTWWGIRGWVAPYQAGPPGPSGTGWLRCQGQCRSSRRYEPANQLPGEELLPVGSKVVGGGLYISRVFQKHWVLNIAQWVYSLSPSILTCNSAQMRYPIKNNSVSVVWPACSRAIENRKRAEPGITIITSNLAVLECDPPRKKVFSGPRYLWGECGGSFPGVPTWCREVDILLACTATKLPPTPVGQSKFKVTYMMEWECGE